MSPDTVAMASGWNGPHRREGAGDKTRSAALLADIVIITGCGDTCPFFPGKRPADPPDAGPARRPAKEARAVRDEIERRSEPAAGLGIVLA